MASGRIHVGTSGWHYEHWVGPFYPEGMPSAEFLTYYARHFRSVELNSTFYHLPKPATLAGWYERTPADFVFTCKASRYITHMKKLKDPEASIVRFFDVIAVLRSKLGAVVFQLPPRWRVDVPRLRTFLAALPNGYRYAFEFRDESWFGDETYDALARHNAAFCIYDLARRLSPLQVTANFVYVRLHGPDGPYCGQYDRRTLRGWARRCRAWATQGRDVFFYFDNDEAGYAASDALSLFQMLELRSDG